MGYNNNASYGMSGAPQYPRNLQQLLAPYGNIGAMLGNTYAQPNNSINNFNPTPPSSWMGNFSGLNSLAFSPLSSYLRGFSPSAPIPLQIQTPIAGQGASGQLNAPPFIGAPAGASQSASKPAAAAPAPSAATTLIGPWGQTFTYAGGPGGQVQLPSSYSSANDVLAKYGLDPDKNPALYTQAAALFNAPTNNNGGGGSG